MFRKLLIILFLIIVNRVNGEYVNTDSLNVRSENNTKSSIREVLHKGRYVKVLNTKNSWSFIEFKSNGRDRVGWVASKFLSKTYQGSNTTNKSYIPIYRPRYYSGLQIKWTDFKCSELLIGRGFSDCTLKVDVSVDVPDSRYGGIVNCSATLDYEEVYQGLGGYISSYIFSAPIAGHTIVHSSYYARTTIYLEHRFIGINKVIQAKPRNLECRYRSY